jgi:hypothetical protein
MTLELDPSACPRWVPQAVKCEADRMLDDPDFAEHHMMIRRLLVDNRMKQVWRTLQRYPATENGRRICKLVHEPMSDHNIALCLIFYHSVCFASGGVRCETAAELETRRQEAFESANQLRKIGAHLLQCWPNHYETPKLAAAISTLARWYNDRAKGLESRHTSVVERNQGNPRHRGFALELANLAFWLFDKRLYGTIATVTNVALVIRTNEPEVSSANVRDWIKAVPNFGYVQSRWLGF